MLNKRNRFINQCEQAGIKDPTNFIKTLYLDGFSCNEMAEKLFNDHNIKVTPKHLSEKIKGLGVIRGYSERKKLAIKRGRMIYKKKQEEEKYKNKMISAKIRMAILTRDNFRCVKCGNSPKTGHSLELHHIDKNPKNNKEENITTYCFLCHRGTHA